MQQTKYIIRCQEIGTLSDLLLIAMRYKLVENITYNHISNFWNLDIDFNYDLDQCKGFLYMWLYRLETSIIKSSQQVKQIMLHNECTHCNLFMVIVPTE